MRRPVPARRFPVSRESVQRVRSFLNALDHAPVGNVLPDDKVASLFRTAGRFFGPCRFMRTVAAD